MHDLGMQWIGMHWNRTWTALLASLLLVACEGTPPPAPRPTDGGAVRHAPPPDDVEAACRALHQAPAHRWTELLPAVTAAGARAEQPLIALLRQQPAADGAQASLAALGRIGGAAAVTFCRQLVEERAPQAVEAALALAELPGEADDEVLLACLQDRHSDASLRTAAACALARHGERDHAARWVGAVVRAGTPAGRADERALGLPGKSRWARERYFVQRTLLALGHRDLCERLDTDASWPTLEKLAPEIEARLRGN
ncbi:MAG: hypothetical protein ACE37K_03300 [Planctomycetota bacterium]